MSSLASKSMHGIIWSAVERFSLQGVQFFIGVVLARLLTPSDFGMIGMLSIFLNLSQIFVDCGFSNALIRQKNTSKKDYGTVFVVNLIISIVAFCVLFGIAPFVARFYSMPELQSVMRVLSIILIINALFTVHKVKLTRNVDFKTQSKASFISAFLSGTLGIILAYNGFGVWSLVYQSICNSLLNLIILSYLLKWFPVPIFCVDSFRELFSFGLKIFVASIINSVYLNLYNIVIGKQFSAASLGYYSRADALGKFPSVNVAGILSRVTYPILSQLQDDSERLKNVYVKYLNVSCFVVFPLMMGLAALAKPVVVLLLGEKWLPSVLLLQILSIGMMLDPICNINLNLLYVKGRSDLVLKLEIVKKTIAVLILVVSLPFGLTGLCVGRAIYGTLATGLNMIYTKNFIDLSMFEQSKLILPSFAMALIMASGCYCLTLFELSEISQLVIGVPLGVLIYFLEAKIFKIQALSQLLAVVRKIH